jgi:ankyrin repeat protein
MKHLKGNSFLNLAGLIIVLLGMGLGAFAEEKCWKTAIQQGEYETVKAIFEKHPELINAQDERTQSTPLLFAISAQKPDIVKYLLSKDVDVNAKNFRGTTALQVAASQGNVKLSKTLIKKGANVNTPNTNGYAPIHFAIKSGNMELFKIFEKLGVDLHMKSKNKSSLLLWAAYGGNIQIVEYLEEKGLSIKDRDEDGDGALHWAASGTSPEMVDYLIKQRGFDPMEKNAKNGIPMEVGIRFGQLETTKYFLDHYNLLKVEPTDGGNWLHVATKSRNIELVSLFADKGLDVNATNNDGRVPLDEAVWSGRIEMIETLLAKGANINGGFCAKTGCVPGGSPLHSAAWFNPQILSYLIEKGASINTKDENGKTPLHNAVSGDCKECLNSLLKNKANIEITDNTGKTPLLTALSLGKCLAAQTLLDAGANTKAKNNDGKQALHFAAIRGLAERTQQLIEKGANIEAKDKDGKTPADYAAYYCNEKTSSVLNKNGAKAPLKENICLLTKTMGKGSAVVWYLNHSGWAVKTANHLLVFDYWQRYACTDEKNINNGYINPEQFKDIKVTVFTSHNHGDHYDKSIFTWAKQHSNIDYVMGFKEEFPVKTHHIADRTQKTIDGVKITTIPSTDSGQGFLVEVDGVSIYHPGDHANGNRNDPTDHNEEIDFIKQKISTVDIAFLPASGCRFPDKIALLQGAVYTCEQLKPAMVLPMHGSNNEDSYADFAKKLKKEVGKVNTKLACYKGDRFLFN